MPDSGWIACSGEGEHALDPVGVIPLAGIAHISSVTSPRVRFIGSMFPRRVQFAGSTGFYVSDNDEFGNPITEYGNVQALTFESFNWYPIETRLSQGQVLGFWWRLPLGITWQIKIFW